MCRSPWRYRELRRLRKRCKSPSIPKPFHPNPITITIKLTIIFPQPPKCPSGSVCNNGACSSIFCTGQTCQNFSACGPGGSCVCASTTDGTGFCVDGSTPCSGLPSCSTTAQCGVGEVCAVQTCCGTPVCVGAAACGGVDLPSSALLLREREWVNGTIASPGVWVP